MSRKPTRNEQKALRAAMRLRFSTHPTSYSFRELHAGVWKCTNANGQWIRGCFHHETGRLQVTGASHRVAHVTHAERPDQRGVPLCGENGFEKLVSIRTFNRLRITRTPHTCARCLISLKRMTSA